jgi:hypothetical protein
MRNAPIQIGVRTGVILSIKELALYHGYQCRYLAKLFWGKSVSRSPLLLLVTKS